jgi:ribosomal protein S18 acetylase RimI-like enzyme
MQREMFLVLEVEGRVVASIMAGYEGHRGWVNYLAVSPSQRRKGYGTTLMRHVEEMLVQAGCPKINLQIRADNTAVLEFYRRLGYARDDVVSLGRRLIPDEPAG